MNSASGRILARQVASCLRATTGLRTYQSKRYIQQQSKSVNDTNSKCSYYSPEEGHIRLSPYDPCTLPDVTLDKYVWENFTNWPNKIAATCIVSGREYTYAQMRDRCAALALRLQQKFKFKPRDVVAVCLPNLPEYPIAFLGSVEAGLTVTTVNPMYTSEEIGRQIVNSNAQFIFGTVADFELLKNACKAANRQIPICCIRTNKNDILPEGAVDFFEIIDPTHCDFSLLKPTDIGVHDMVALPYSSGTTGLPKGVMLSHFNVTCAGEILNSKPAYSQLVRDTTDSFQEVVPGILPFFHIYGLTLGMVTKLQLGCKIVTMPRFNPDDLIKSLTDYKASILYLVPPIIHFLINSPKVQSSHMEHLRVVVSGAAPIGALDAERLVTKQPNLTFLQGYGMTETSSVIILSSPGLKKYASVGCVTPNTEVKIASMESENREGLGPNTVGEIWVRGPQVMKGYLNNEEATIEIFLDGNWMRTGDVGYYDEEGCFFITDRMKELIKVKGFQVAPAELEEILRDHPKILDAGVVGVSHDQYGEAPRAFVVLRPGQEATEKEIQDFVADKVAVYKKLEGGVKFMNEIPKSVSGKILRRELKANHC